MKTSINMLCVLIIAILFTLNACGGGGGGGGAPPPTTSSNWDQLV